MTDFATAAGHWYSLDGSPQYTIVGKNGKERNTTLADARKNALVPSVTTIIRCAAAPALEKWKRDQVLLAALTLPRQPDEPETAWLRRVEQDWQEQGRAAADRGTEIHAAVEQHYRGQPSEEWWEWAKVATAEIERVCGPQEWLPERSFAHPAGYGGKLDLHSAQWVVDIKTKDGLPYDRLNMYGKPILDLYDEHYMQLAAYARGVGIAKPRAGILFVDRNQPGAVLVEAGDEGLRDGLAMFDALLAFWQAKTGHRPQ